MTRERQLPRRFPVLEQVLAGYLNQDFLCDYASADAAIADFASSASPDEIESTREELRQFILLVEGTPNPGEALLGLGCYYDPVSDGMTVVDWLRTVAKVFDSQSP